MVTKPIIAIDVDSEPFKRFQRLFDQYKKDVESTNAEWKAMVANQNNADLSAYAQRAHKAFDRLAISVGSVGTKISGAAKHALSFAHTLEHITASITKWGALITGIGFFGIDKLAASVLERSRAAGGIGVSVGQQSAFRVNMSAMLSSPDSVLAAAANARQDYSKWGALAAMGINPLAAQNQNPFDLSMQLETRARALWKQHPNVQWAQARGLTEFFGIEDLRRMGAMSDKDFFGAQAKARRDVTALGFGAQQSAAWTRLSQQLQRAGLEIERVLVNGLVKLAPEFDRLSQAAVKMIDDFFQSGEAKKAIDALAVGIKDFANYLLSPKFHDDVRTFVDDFEAVAKAIVNALKWLGIIPSGDKNQLPPPNPGTHWDMSHGFPMLKNDTPAMPEANPGTHWDMSHGFPLLLPNGTKSAFTSIERQNGLPPGLLNAVYQTESGGGRNLVSAKGALGPFQFMPGTAAQYGVTDPFNLWQSANGAGRMFRDLMNQFGGNIDMALAAYNWGAGNLRNDISRYGARWRQHLPRETEDYINKIHGQDTNGILQQIARLLRSQNGRQPGVNINLNNSTAGQVAIQANNAIAL